MARIQLLSCQLFGSLLAFRVSDGRVDHTYRFIVGQTVLAMEYGGPPFWVLNNRLVFSAYGYDESLKTTKLPCILPLDQCTGAEECYNVACQGLPSPVAPITPGSTPTTAPSTLCLLPPPTPSNLFFCNTSSLRWTAISANLTVSGGQTIVISHQTAFQNLYLAEGSVLQLNLTGVASDSLDEFLNFIVASGTIDIKGTVIVTLGSTQLTQISTLVLDSTVRSVSIINAVSISENPTISLQVELDSATGNLPCENAIVTSERVETSDGNQQLSMILSVDSAQCNLYVSTHSSLSRLSNHVID